MAGPKKRTSRTKAVKEPTSQEKQIKFHVSLRKRDKELAEEYGRYEKGDWSARARELMYKGLMAERMGDNGSTGAVVVAPVPSAIDANGESDLEQRKRALMLANLDESFDLE